MWGEQADKLCDNIHSYHLVYITIFLNHKNDEMKLG